MSFMSKQELDNSGFAEVMFMGFTAKIALFVLIIIILAVYFIISGIKMNDWKLIIISFLGCVIIIGGVYLALISFITSM